MRCAKGFFAISLLLVMAACSHVHPAGVAMTPNPLPPPGYRAVCASKPLPFNAFVTSCAPAAGEQVAIVRAKG